MSEGDDNTSISLCPNPQLLERVKQLCRKSGEEDCSCSVVSKVGPKTMIKCHCGASYAMYENRLQNAEKHHSDPSHTSKSKQKRSAKRVFSNFFKPSNGQNAPIPSVRKQAVERVCVGLNDTTWHRPKARPENSISAFSQRSLLRERGAPPIDKISYEITGKKRYSKLNGDELALVEQQRLSEVTYVVEKDLVRSVSCKRNVQCPASMTPDQVVCEKCLALKQDRSLITSLNPKSKVSASNGENELRENAKYTPIFYLRPDPIRQSVIRNSQLKDLVKPAEQVVDNQGEDVSQKL